MIARRPAFLTLDEVLALHADQIERYGGAPGVRDVALLESAVAAPRATFDGRLLHATVPEMAAAYLFHLAQNVTLDRMRHRTYAGAITPRGGRAAYSYLYW